MTAGNDVVDLSKWNGTLSVTIGDAFSGDNDKVTVMAGALQNDNLKLTSIENLEIINSGVTTSVTLNGANFKGLESIKLIGDATTLDVNVNGSGLTYGVKIDATANADTIIGSDKADTINGGAGNDIIFGNDGNDVLTGGNGADEFVVGTVKAAGVDQILDFSAEDKISMTGFVPSELKKFDASTFSTVTYKTLDSVLATFGPNGANETKNGDIAIFTYDGKTYALLAKGAFTETGSALVDITGANVASLTESNFGAASPTPGGSDNNPTTTYANYTLFNDAVATGIPTQSAKITTMSAAQAATLATTDSGNLKYIAPEGIQAISGDNISINMTPATTFDATAFDAKLLRGIEGTIKMNITGTASADTITASKLGGTISAGKDTVVFAATAAANGEDTITGFTAGSDKIAIGGTKGFLNANYTASSDFVGAGDQINTNGSGDLTSKKVFVSKTAVKGGSSGIFDSSGTSSGKFKLGDNQKLFVVDTTDNNTLYFVVGAASVATDGAVVTKVGTLNIGETLTSADFTDVA